MKLPCVGRNNVLVTCAPERLEPKWLRTLLGTIMMKTNMMVEGDAGGDKIVIPQITTNKIGDDEHDG